MSSHKASDLTPLGFAADFPDSEDVHHFFGHAVELYTTLPKILLEEGLLVFTTNLISRDFSICRPESLNTSF